MGILAYTRELNEQKLYILINGENEEKQLPLRQLTGYRPLFMGAQEDNQQISFAPYAGIVLKKIVRFWNKLAITADMPRLRFFE